MSESHPGGLKDAAADQIGHVAGTAKDEVSHVAHEAATQVKDLYAQTRSEVSEQAGVQQQRLADGLRSFGEELGGMADGSDARGLASDLVRQASARADGAAAWLGARDPASVLAEVKAYARRKPGTFIAIAAITGVVAGRLTRALAGRAADDTKAAADAPAVPRVTAPAPVVPPVVERPAFTATDGFADETPLYTERVSTLGEESPDEGYRR